MELVIPTKACQFAYLFVCFFFLCHFLCRNFPLDFALSLHCTKSITYINAYWRHWRTQTTNEVTNSIRKRSGHCSVPIWCIVMTERERKTNTATGTSSLSHCGSISMTLVWNDNGKSHALVHKSMTKSSATANKSNQFNDSEISPNIGGFPSQSRIANRFACVKL